VARRWFKTSRGYTDSNGYFSLSKKFKNKVKIIVKFENNDAEVRALRGARLWQVFFPVKKKIATISRGQAKNNISYTFMTNTDRASKGNRYWSAATVHNSIQEYKQYAAAENIGQAPGGMKIFISTLTRSGAAPMFNKRSDDGIPRQYFDYYLLSSITSEVGSLLINKLKREVDIMVSYGTLNSDRIKETMYHELTHAAHYNKVGNGWYGNFVRAEIAGIINTILDANYAPYGRKTDNDAGLIALGESWAYYMGHYMTDKHYNFQSSYVSEQTITYFNNWPVIGLSSHLNLLEDFNPYRTDDPFNWIPQGLYYDLRDNGNDASVSGRVPLNDVVSGFSNSQLFNALQSSTTSVPSYRQSLVDQNVGNQTQGLNNIFTFYGY